MKTCFCLSSSLNFRVISCSLLVLQLCMLSSYALAENQAASEELTPGFQASELLAASLPELANALTSGETSSEALVRGYLQRIAIMDRTGPKLRSIITLNPDALETAKALDQSRHAGLIHGPLHGIPVLLKDNIESADNMPTTAGALALEKNTTGRDAPLVAALRNAGAIILGKTNLSQWANFRSESSMSGWSALGGQVKNPHMLDRNPCGSSSGSAVATAASLAAASIGTETNGSVICPAAINGIVGFKPTVGEISQRWIVPISPSQDTAGPMTRTVTGTALLFAYMSGSEFQTLDKTALKGKRIGVLRYASGSNHEILQRFDKALATAEASGAELVEISDAPPQPKTFRQDGFYVLKYEFQRALNDYLMNSPADIPVRTLTQLIAFNQRHASLELSLFNQDIFAASQATADDDPSHYRTVLDRIQQATRADGIDFLLKHYKVDALAFPSNVTAPPRDAVNGDIWPDWIGVGWMAAVAGYPHITVPMGTVGHLPVGFSLIAGKHQDWLLLQLGFAFEQASQLRTEPQYLRSAADVPELERALNGKKTAVGH